MSADAERVSYRDASDAPTAAEQALIADLTAAGPAIRRDQAGAASKTFDPAGVVLVPLRHVGIGPGTFLGLPLAYTDAVTVPTFAVMGGAWW